MKNLRTHDSHGPVLLLGGALEGVPPVDGRKWYKNDTKWYGILTHDGHGPVLLLARALEGVPPVNGTK